jgi:4-amino-4-deoxy-L-arabinose transferase-like glycosyltransferase
LLKRWGGYRYSHNYLLMALIALVLRLAVVGFVYPERLNPDRDHWRFAGETGRIARSIVEGQGVSSPLHADTGPTAWMTPLYPLLLAGVFKLFGIYTKASAIVMLSLDSLFSGLTCIPVFLIARKSFGERAAVWAGWAWALFPYAIYFSADFIWATTLTTLLLTLIFLAALSLEDSDSWRKWLGFGLLCGISALTDPIVLAVAVPLAAWMAFRLWRQKQSWAISSTVAFLAFALTVSPWFVRNYRTFHSFIPFRDNAGLELYLGNQGQTWHFAPGGFHPSDTPREWAEFQQLGELKYMQHKREQALTFIAAHPGLFVELSLRRALYMWTNFWSFSRRYLQAEPFDPFNILLCTSLTILALAGLWRLFQSGLVWGMPFAIALFCFPLVYYFTHPEDYYRRPIDPIFVILAGYALANRRAREQEDRVEPVEMLEEDELAAV